MCRSPWDPNGAIRQDSFNLLGYNRNQPILITSSRAQQQVSSTKCSAAELVIFFLALTLAPGFTILKFCGSPFCICFGFELLYLIEKNNFLSYYGLVSNINIFSLAPSSTKFFFLSGSLSTQYDVAPLLRLQLQILGWRNLIKNYFIMYFLCDKIINQIKIKWSVYFMTLTCI